jgi:hypothetical protein
VPILDAGHEQQEGDRQACGEEEHAGQLAGEHTFLVHLERAIRHTVLSAGGVAR